MNENHPLVKAIQGQKGKPSGEPFAPMEGPRSLKILHDEMTALPDVPVGESVSVNVSWKVHTHGNGYSTIHVDNIKPDSGGMAKKTS